MPNKSLVWDLRYAPAPQLERSPVLRTAERPSCAPHSLNSAVMYLKEMTYQWI